jgi:CrcB protein
MDKLIWVVLGGGFGSGARYLVSLGAARWLGPDLPWGTFSVNVLGSLALGLILAHPAFTPSLRIALGTGVMGGFTTYSSFNAETLRLLERGSYATAAIYAGLTFVVCLGGGAAGLWLGRV